MGVDNLVASYVDSTTFLHSPSNIQHSPMDIQNSVLVSGQSSVSLTSEELSPDDLTSSSGHSRLMDPLNMNLSGMGMVNPNVVSNRRHQGSSHSGSSDDLPCKFSRWCILSIVGSLFLSLGSFVVAIFLFMLFFVCFSWSLYILFSRSYETHYCFIYKMFTFKFTVTHWAFDIYKLFRFGF